MKPLGTFSKFLLSIVFFAFVFYKQNVGINFSLFSLFIWILSFDKIAESRKNSVFWLISLSLFISASAFAWYGDALSFVSLFLSLGAFGIYTHYKTINVLFYPVLLLYSLVTFVGRIFFIDKWLPKIKPANQTGKKVLAYFIIPAILLSIFIYIYAAGSEIFSSFFENIHLNIDVWIFILTIAAGFYFSFNYWFMMMPNAIAKQSNKISYNLYFNENSKPTFHFLDAEFERKSGEISLILLNILLLFFIITYNYEIFVNSSKINNLSSEVHEQIGAVILSIVMAIAVIMFYFKSTFNFDEKAGLLKKLTYIWIALNSLLIVSALSKNTEYVCASELTFKRIGVYIFLLLSVVGLYFTCIKIKNKKSNLFLIGRMFVVFFATLVLNCSINWSWIVTKYNLTHSSVIDVNYLQTLDYNKEILYNYFKLHSADKNKLEELKKYVDDKNSEPFLSSTLYFSSLKLN